ncbi:MAG TPA: hypothetical protein VIW29_14340 [Polyangiaceae bacterium]
MRRARVVVGMLGLLAIGCASSQGAPPKPLPPSEVAELATAPAGYRLGERLSEKCSGRQGLREIDEESLAAVDCSLERVTRALRARAASLSSHAIVGKRCHVSGGERYSVRCSARILVSDADASPEALAMPALVERGPAPSPAQVLDLDEPDPSQSAAIRVSFAPSAGAKARAPRRYDRVAETREPAVGRSPLGRVSARCQDCDELALRHALRVTAGRMGAGEVAAVRCLDEGEHRCVATALEPWSY